jgi:hypothetical protein
MSTFNNPVASPVTSGESLIDALSKIPEDRIEKIKDDDETLTFDEQKLMDSVKLTKKLGKKNAYWVIDMPIGLSQVIRGNSDGYEKWGDTNENDGNFKISIRFEEQSQMTQMCIMEALLKRKLGNLDDQQAQSISGVESSKISREFGLKADIAMSKSRQPCVIYRQSADGVHLTPRSFMEAPYEVGGMPSVVKDFDPKTNKMISPPALSSYRVIASVEPTIIISGYIKYKVTQIVICEEMAAQRERRRVPVSMKEAVSNRTWKLDAHQNKGLNNNSWHSLTNGSSKYPDPIWVHGDRGERDRGESSAMGLKVVRMWENQENATQPLTMCVEVMPSDSQLIAGVCASIEKELSDKTSDMFPKHKPTKKSRYGVQLYTPLHPQTEADIEKNGIREEHWYKIKIVVSGTSKIPATPFYCLASQSINEHSAINIDKLLETDAELLVREGILVKCDSYMDVHPGAEIIAAVSVSKVDTSPKFSFAFRAKYVIALSLGVAVGAGREIVMPDGSVQVPSVLSETEYMSAMRGDARDSEAALGECNVSEKRKREE